MHYGIDQWVTLLINASQQNLIVDFHSSTFVPSVESQYLGPKYEYDYKYVQSVLKNNLEYKYEDRVPQPWYKSQPHKLTTAHNISAHNIKELLLKSSKKISGLISKHDNLT